ncbi:MAG: hypothetical protein WAW29_03640, partial [Streptococcus infantarius]
LVAFHYKSYGTFLILKKPYNSTVELPTTEIIEPFFLVKKKSFTVISQSNSGFYVIIERRNIVNLRVINVKKELNHG